MKFGILFLSFTILLNIFSCEDNNGNNGNDCSTHCDSRDGCQYFASINCPGVNPQYIPDIICVFGKLYECKTPPDSPCCDGYYMEYLPIGDCEEDTPHCGENADGDMEENEGDSLES